MRRPRRGVPRCPRRALPPALLAEVERYACGEALPLVLAGLARTADYQDADYAALYWRRLLPFAKLAGDGGGAECELLAVAARQLALAMTYSDVIRVAELKLRASRVERIRAGFGLGQGEVLELAEYMHPRVEEVVDTMPTGLGRRVFNSAIGRAVLRRLTARGPARPDHLAPGLFDALFGGLSQAVAAGLASLCARDGAA